MPMNCTLTYDDLTNDVDDTSGDANTAACIGPMYFIPQIQDGARIPALTSLARPAGLAVRAFTGYMDTDGQLRSESGGSVGVRVWANDPDWHLDRFTYLVRASFTDPLGRPIPFTQFAFDAPSEDRAVPLALELPRPGQKFSRGRPGIDITGVLLDGSGNLVFTRQDGVELTTDALVLDDSIANSNLFGAAYGMTFG